MTTDYFAAGNEICQRLRIEVPELEAVYTARELGNVDQNTVKYPSACVLYHEDRVVNSDGGRSSAKDLQIVDQAWYVVIAIRNVRNQNSGDAARDEAGPIIHKVLKALQGWQPTTLHGPLMRVNGSPIGYKTGMLFFPILFTTRLTV